MRGAAVLLLGCLGCSRAQPAPFAGPKLIALHASVDPTLDGEAEEGAWIATPSTGAFGSVLDGGFLSPHTELRALWTERSLWLNVYCADQDLRSSDAVHLVLQAATGLSFTVSPTGKLTGAPEGLRLAVDLDGTLDADDGEDDEEWAAEIEVPWSALGLQRPPPSLEVTAWREDTPKGAPARTVSWSRASNRPAAGLIELR